jgi:hypothetical protein
MAVEANQPSTLAVLVDAGCAVSTQAAKLAIIFVRLILALVRYSFLIVILLQNTTVWA